MSPCGLGFWLSVASSHSSSHCKGASISRLGTLVLALLWFVFTAGSVSAQGQHGCQFVRGFKTLRDLVGSHIVGECLENEHYNAIGDSNQRTTGGLLAWRKADNWTAFTDGYRTWINGPNGLVQRLNTERFEWEADYAPGGEIATPTPTPVPPPTPTPKPTPTLRPTPRPKPTTTPVPIEARLQQALDLIASTGDSVGASAVAHIQDNHVSVVFANIADVAHYNPNTNSIVFNEGMRSQPLEVLAYILVHERVHSANPWTERGEECFSAEFIAEVVAVVWWKAAYGENGHPNPANNAWIGYFNYLLSLYQFDLASPGQTRSFENHLRAAYEPVCGTSAPAPTPTPTPIPTSRPTPTPAPTPIAAGSTLDDVEHMLAHYRAFARRAIGEAYGISESSIGALRIYRSIEWAVEGMPYVYLLFTWSEYPSGEYPNTREFARSYVLNSRHYGRIAYRWLESDPCTWPAEAQEYMEAHAIDYPGHIRGMVEAMLTIPSLAIHYWNAALSTAERDYFNDAEAYLDQFRCSS